MSKTKQEKQNRNKRNKTNFANNEFTFQLFSLLSIIMLFLQRIVILNQSGMQGGAYFFSVYNFMLLFGLLLPFTLPVIIADYTREICAKEQYKNAKRVLYAGFMISTIYNIALAIIAISSYLTFKNVFLLGDFELLIFIFIFSGMVLFSYTGVLVGFLNGIQRHALTNICNLIQTIMQLVFMIAFSGIFLKYGNKVAVVLKNEEYKYSYAASGAALGYLIGVIIALLFAVFIYNKNIKRFNKQLRNDLSRKTLDVYDCFRLVSAKVFPYGLCLFLGVLPLFIDQWVFLADSHNKNNVLVSYEWGAFVSVFGSFLAFLVILIYSICIGYKKDFLKHYKNKNASDLRKINSKIKNFSMILGLFFMMVVLILAPEFTESFAFAESRFAVRLLRACAPLLCLTSYATAELGILILAEKFKKCILNGLIAVATHILIVLVFFKNTGAGIYAFLIGGYVSVIVFAVLSALVIYSELKCKDKIKTLFFKPGISVGIASVLCLLLHLLFGLFMPAWISLLVNIIITMVALLIALCKTQCLDEFSLSTSPYGQVIGRICSIMHLF